MAGIETLAVVCSIFQVISFGRETISLCKKVYRTGTSVDPALAENADLLGHFSSQIHEFDTTNVRSRDDQQLYDVLKKCQTASRDLQEEVSFITGQVRKDSLAATLKIAAKTNWRKRRLETLERKLGDIQKLVETGLLVRICNRIDFTQTKLDALDADLQLFLLNYQAGQRTATGLISTESLRTRHHISSEISRLEGNLNLSTAEARHSAKDIKRHVSETVGDTMAALSKSQHDLYLDAKKRKNRERLLQCLRFPRLDERRYQITESFPRTFQWVFGEEIFAEDENNEDRDSDGGSGKSGNSGKDFIHAWRRYLGISDSDNYDTPWDSFRDWLRSDNLVYWISGKPGAGKTTLVKYLLSDSRTKLALDVWKSEAVLLSHFFWRPGSPMQQNIKGLLCSLLYQLIEANDALVGYIVSQFNNILRKKSYTDWNIMELKKVCFQAMQCFGKPLCIFLDGLDEVDPRDGTLELFEVVDVIKQMPSTKLCLSSRSEPPIVRRLGRYPKLRIQDLTLNDLWVYAEGKLQFPTLYLGGQYKEDRHAIIRELVKKAEGVFLWLCLAVKSLNAGLDNEDHLGEVLQRTERLPPDLARLYMDMWSRFNEDHAVYRQSAALYLKLVIASLRAPWQPSLERPGCLTQSAITVFEMAIAIASSELRFELAIPTAEKLMNSCSDTTRLVQTRCASLLEVVTQSKSIHFGLERQHLGPEFSSVIPFGDGSQTIRFIHRTAFDFLTDTVEGASILNADVTSEQSLYLKLFRAGLSSRYLFLSFQYIKPPCLEEYAEELSRIRHLTSSFENSALEAQFQETATFLELSGSSGALPLCWDNRSKSDIVQKDEFLVYAASFGLSKYVTEALLKRKICAQIKSDILLAVSVRAVSNLKISQDDIALFEDLLNRGADPNYKGCVLMFEGEAGTWQIASSFCGFLAEGLQATFHSATKLSIQRVCHVIDSFLRHGANASDLVNINILIPDFGKIEFVPVSKITGWLYNGKRTYDCYCLRLSAFILIDVLVHQLEETLCKTGNSQEKCCNVDHVTSIRAKTKLINTAAKSRIIALTSGPTHYCAVSDEDSIYLSDAVLQFLINSRPQDVTTSLRARYLEVYRRSETKADLNVLLENEGLTWNWVSHGHDVHDECKCGNKKNHEIQGVKSKA